MSRFLKATLASATLVAVAGVAQAGDPVAGEAAFRQCATCHMVGDGARARVGPPLNAIYGMTAGTQEGFRYSPAMVTAGEEGLVWNTETMSAYFADPRGYIRGNRMAFAGLRNDDDIANVIAYLKTYSPDAEASEDDSAAAQPAEEAETEVEVAVAAETPPEAEAISFGAVSDGPMGLGRTATEAEVTAWDIDVRPDGLGLPEGRGTVAMGEPLYTDHCASCHGDFGEAVDRWPVLAGGFDTLTDERPVKTVGSYWPHLSTVYDYIRRAMPFGNARVLTDDEVYAITAYVLYLNDIVEDEDFELSHENFADIEMPNATNFIADGRPEEAHYAAGTEPCMSDCKPGVAEVTMRALVLDVTPEAGDDDAAGVGTID